MIPLWTIKFGLSLCINVAPQSLREQLTVRVCREGGGLGLLLRGLGVLSLKKKKKEKDCHCCDPFRECNFLFCHHDAIELRNHTP
jgi:hypothetical protein